MANHGIMATLPGCLGLHRIHLYIISSVLIPQAAIDQNVLVTQNSSFELTHGKGPKHHCTSLATEQHGSVDDSSTRHHRSPSHIPVGISAVYLTSTSVNFLWWPRAAVNSIPARGTICLITVVNVFGAVLMPATQRQRRRPLHLLTDI